MRRSLAPSESANAPKRHKFCPPFLKSQQLEPVTPKTDENQRSSFQENGPTEDGFLRSINKVRSTQDVLRLIDNVDLNERFATSKVENGYADGNWVAGLNSAVGDPPIAFIRNNTKSTERSQSSTDSTTIDEVSERYFSVVWCKLSTRKHKRWEGDAILIVKKSSVVLKNMEGKMIGQGSSYKRAQLEALEDGSQLVIGGKEVEIVAVVSSEAYTSGRCFLTVSDDRTFGTEPTEDSADICKSKYSSTKSTAVQRPSRCKAGHRPRSAAPKHDPLKPGALVMPRPSASHQGLFNASNLPVIDVVVDPAISQYLRPHQREGVIFLYECVTKMRKLAGEGAILADEMGLGKTLQCITLIWTLLKQGPYGGKPILKLVLIVTPSSLMKNWVKEFYQWLGREKIVVHVADHSDKVELFLKAPMQPVLIISYDLLLRHHESLQRLHFDLMVCDEGHRLKNGATKTATVLAGLPIRKRVVLTGTPIQNDLQEFYALVEFCNPGTLGSSSTFRRIYEEPILRSREQDASTRDCRIGEERVNELIRLTAPFVLRRTQDINNAYLPPKDEYIVFCKPSKFQVSVYQKILDSHYIKDCIVDIHNDGSSHLKCITALKKLCNHPRLIYEAILQSRNLSNGGIADEIFSGAESLFPPNFEARACDPRLSGKTRVVVELLKTLRPAEQQSEKRKGERVVLVSSSTKMLDLLQVMCRAHDYPFCRLDGSTPTNQRQALVDRFNSPSSGDYIFLLSSKAGGMGLNLIGASRIVLMDVDWNPANDLQAMSRVWRDGQKKRVHIYRLITTGTIEEKIYQRQIIKQNLSGTMAETKDHKKMQFSNEDLKDLFSLHLDTPCNTHDLLGCFCYLTLSQTESANSGSEVKGGDSNSRPSQLKLTKSWQMPKNLTMDQLMSWDHLHIENLSPETLQTSYLHGAKEDISFLFHNFTSSECGS